MTSVIRVVFVDLKDIAVEIDNIESISPRGLELMFAKIEKTYLGMKGKNVASLKEAAVKAEAEREANAAKEKRIEDLKQEELAKHRGEAEAAARKRFEAMSMTEKEAILKHNKEEDMKPAVRDFIGAVAQAIVSDEPKVATKKK